MALECDNPFCGTLALMIGRGSVTFAKHDCGPVRVLWMTDSGRYEGSGANVRDAVNECCEQELADETKA